MSEPIFDVRPLGFPWEAFDPFLFCVHHEDAYPSGNAHMGPSTPLTGRDLGQDFAGKDGWRMYHGRVIPGFPQHPHRGFETVTIVRRGIIDHADSLGATARFGSGDVQWLTAGGGIVHSEMFPLLDASAPNPLELFQIWLNLPGEDKLVAPHFAMLWNEDIPRRCFEDGRGRRTEVTVVAGELDGHRAPPPPPRSWASRGDTGVAIWCIRMDPAAVWTLPALSDPRVVRTLYVFRGAPMRVASQEMRSRTAVVARGGDPIALEAGEEPCEILLLQGRPIGEPVVQYGPFVMNTREQIQRAVSDYRTTQFGGWPWPSDDPVHARGASRFARHADGRVEPGPGKDLPNLAVPVGGIP